MVSTTVTPSVRSSCSSAHVVRRACGVHPGGGLVDEDELRAGRPAPSRARAAAAGRPTAAGTACARTRRGRAGRPAASVSSGCACSAAMWSSISIARTPDQAPPSCSITPIRGSSSRRSRTGVEPEHPHRALLRRAVALAGLERGGLAGAVGTEDRGDRAALDGERQLVDGGLCRRTASPGRRPGRRERGRAPGQSRKRRQISTASGLLAVQRLGQPGRRRRRAGRATARVVAGLRRRIAVQTAAGVHGRSMWRTPRWLTRVDDGVLHRRGGADRAGLADALGAELVEVVGVSVLEASSEIVSAAVGIW